MGALARLSADAVAACCAWLPADALMEAELVSRGVRGAIAAHGVWRARFLLRVARDGWCVPAGPPPFGWKVLHARYEREWGVAINHRVRHGCCTVAWRVPVPLDGRELRVWTEERPFSVDAYGADILWQFEAFFPAGFLKSSQHAPLQRPLHYVAVHEAAAAARARGAALQRRRRLREHTAEHVRRNAAGREEVEEAAHGSGRRNYTSAGPHMEDTSSGGGGGGGGSAPECRRHVAPPSPPASPPPQGTLRVWTTNPWTPEATRHYYGAYCTISLRDPFNTAHTTAEQHVDIDSGEAFHFGADALAAEHAVPARVKNASHLHDRRRRPRRTRGRGADENDNPPAAVGVVSTGDRRDGASFGGHYHAHLRDGAVGVGVDGDADVSPRRGRGGALAGAVGRGGSDCSSSSSSSSSSNTTATAPVVVADATEASEDAEDGSNADADGVVTQGATAAAASLPVLDDSFASLDVFEGELPSGEDRGEGADALAVGVDMDMEAVSSALDPAAVLADCFASPRRNRGGGYQSGDATDCASVGHAPTHTQPCSTSAGGPGSDGGCAHRGAAAAAASPVGESRAAGVADQHHHHVTQASAGTTILGAPGGFVDTTTETLVPAPASGSAASTGSSPADTGGVAAAAASTTSTVRPMLPVSRAAAAAAAAAANAASLAHDAAVVDVGGDADRGAGAPGDGPAAVTAEVGAIHAAAADGTGSENGSSEFDEDESDFDDDDDDDDDVYTCECFACTRARGHNASALGAWGPYGSGGVDNATTATHFLHPEAVFYMTMTLALEMPMPLAPYYALLSTASPEPDVVKIGYCRAIFEIARYKRKHGGTFIKPGDRSLVQLVDVLRDRRTSEALRFEVYHALFNILGTGAVLLPEDVAVDLLWSCVVQLACMPILLPPSERMAFNVHLAENLLGSVFNLLLHPAARTVMGTPQALHSLTRILHDPHFAICNFSAITILLSLRAWGVAFPAPTTAAVARHVDSFMAAADPTDPKATGVAWDESDIASFFVPLLRSGDLLCVRFVSWCIHKYYFF